MTQTTQIQPRLLRAVAALLRASERHSLPHQDTLLSALVADRCGGNGDRTWIDAVNKAARQAFAVSMQGGALLAEKDGVVISKLASTTAAPPLSWPQNLHQPPVHRQSPSVMDEKVFKERCALLCLVSQRRCWRRRSQQRQSRAPSGCGVRS